MFVVDASVWVARYVRKDEHHQICRDWLHDNLQEGVEIYEPSILLPEVAGPIARVTNMPPAGFHAALQVYALPQVSIVPIDDSLTRLSAQFAADLRLRGADAVYVALASLKSMTLITLDGEQLTRTSSVITAKRPSAVTPAQ